MSNPELAQKVPSYAVFGYCILCGKRMIGHEVIDGIYQIKLSGEYRNVIYMLDDGSRMRVGMCEGCKDKLDGSEIEHVMNKAYRGWQHEVETYSAWDEEKKKSYLAKYKQRKILFRSDNVSGDIAAKQLKEYRDKKEKEVKGGPDN